MITSNLKKGINIILPGELEWALENAAKRDNVAEVIKATELLRLGLEIEEDIVWDKLAKTRDTRDAKFVSHIRAWKR